MIDAVATLDPANGLARAVHLAPRTGAEDFWLVAVDIGLSELRPAGPASFALDCVGATGWRRGDAILRAAGEAVERRALVPQSGDDSVIKGVGPSDAARVRLSGDIGRASEAFDRRAVACRPAVELRPGDDGAVTASPVLLPVAAADDPVPPGDVHDVDSTPSGAAAGYSWEYAAMRALLESVERDAVQVAWTSGAVAHRVSLADAAALAASRRHPDAARLAAHIRGTDAAPTEVVLLATDVPGVVCAVGVMVDRLDGVPLVAAGCSAAWSATDAILGAGREVLQIRNLLAGFGSTCEPLPRGAVVCDEPARARYCRSPEAARAAVEWLSRCEPLDAEDALGTTTGAPLPSADPADRLRHIVAALDGHGLRPVVCDLSDRIPGPVRRLGWHAVRAVVLGHQVLRMDEGKQFTWAPGRLARAGTDPVHAGAAPPHPLI